MWIRHSLAHRSVLEASILIFMTGHADFISNIAASIPGRTCGLCLLLRRAGVRGLWRRLPGNQPNRDEHREQQCNQLDGADLGDCGESHGYAVSSKQSKI